MGFLSPQAGSAEILAAIQSVKDGLPYLPPEATRRFVKDLQRMGSS